MGRTVPTFRQLIDDAIARWSKFRRALRREDQEYFDRLFRRVRSYTQAATYQASDNPMEAILLSIALDQEKRLDVLERAVAADGCGLYLEPAGNGCAAHLESAGKSLEQLDAPQNRAATNPADPNSRLNGWIFDLYPSPHGMKLWLIEPNQKRHRLIDRFAPVFYVSGPDAVLRRLRAAMPRGSRTRSPAVSPSAWICGSSARVRCWKSKSRIPTNILRGRAGCASFDASLRLYNSDLMLASLYCWQRGIFPLARVEAEVDSEGRILALECRDTEWALDYELPPLEILRVRLGGLRARGPHARRPFGQWAALEIEVDGREFELDESGEPAAVAFQHLLARHDPDLILSDWGDATILPRLAEQAARLRLPLALNRDPGRRSARRAARAAS